METFIIDQNSMSTTHSSVAAEIGNIIEIGLYFEGAILRTEAG
jgi:hypothetical protein